MKNVYDITVPLQADYKLAPISKLHLKIVTFWNVIMIETHGYYQTKLIRFLLYFSMKPLFITLRRTLLKNTHVFTYFFSYRHMANNSRKWGLLTFILSNQKWVWIVFWHLLMVIEIFQNVSIWGKIHRLRDWSPQEGSFGLDEGQQSPLLKKHWHWPLLAYDFLWNFWNLRQLSHFWRPPTFGGRGAKVGVWVSGYHMVGSRFRWR